MLLDATLQENGRDAQGKVWGKGLEAPCPLQRAALPAPLGVHQVGSTNLVCLKTDFILVTEFSAFFFFF